jgi:RNA polymerase sigma-70 factor (ECF subfamily)
LQPVLSRGFDGFDALAPSEVPGFPDPAGLAVGSVIGPDSAPPAPPSSEEHGRRLDALAARARNGDRAALAELLELDYDRLHGICWKLLREREAALDATQEAAVAIARGIVRFDGYSRYTTWAYRIAANAALDELRRRARRPVVSLDGQTEAALSALASHAPSGADRLVESLSVRGAMRRLPEEQSVALLLRHELDLDYEDIARITGVPVGTVRSRISRGRAALREVLGGHDDPATISEARNSGAGGAVERDARP